MIDNKEKLQFFLDLILNVVSKPGMYGIDNIKELSIFIQGYMCTRSPDGADVDIIIGEFRAFVNAHFKTQSDYDWHKLIYLHSGGGRHSIQLFGELFTLYLTENGMFNPHTSSPH